MHEIKLLKNSRQKNGYTYHNLYIQVDGGEPIAVKAVFETRKLKNFLLAIATDCEITTKTIVAERGEVRQDEQADEE